jgi:putative aldouronate transport system permease protein
MGDPKYFRIIFVTMNIWKGFGWSAIIYLAAIAGIDPQLYEAAIVDGAGRWKQMLHISLPGIKNVIIILFILRIGRILDVGFESVILLYNPSIYETADVISTFVYRRGISGSGSGGIPDFSFATAVGMFKSVISFLLVLISNKLSKMYSEKSLF